MSKKREVNLLLVSGMEVAYLYYTVKTAYVARRRRIGIANCCDFDTNGRLDF